MAESLTSQTTAAVRAAYDGLAETYARLLPDTRAEAVLDLAMIDAFAEAVGAGGRVLDAGCGTGRISRYLADRSLRVRGTDLSPGMIGQARRSHPDIAFAVADTQHLPFVDAALDGVVLWYSTIHAADDAQPRIFAEASRVLRAGGSLVVAFQCGTGAREVTGYRSADGHADPLVRHLYTADQVSGWMRDAGLDETSRLIRAPAGHEKDPQAVLIARRGS